MYMRARAKSLKRKSCVGEEMVYVLFEPIRRKFLKNNLARQFHVGFDQATRYHIKYAQNMAEYMLLLDGVQYSIITLDEAAIYDILVS